MKREQKKNIEKLEKVIEEKKKLPKDIKKKINAKAITNLVIVLAIGILFTVLYFGMMNIPTDTYLICLKVFSIILMIASIVLFEIGYRKDKEGVWLHGVEAFVVAVFTLYLVYFYSIFYSNFGVFLLSAGVVVLSYYAIKIIVIQKRMKKEYIKSLGDIGEIVKK